MELKFANDNLRWRLQQKQASLNSSQETIARLQAALGVLEGEVHTLRRDAKAAAKEVSEIICALTVLYLTHSIKTDDFMLYYCILFAMWKHSLQIL